MFAAIQQPIPTLRQVLREYFEVRNLSDRTIYQYTNLSENGLRDWLNLPVTSITKTMVQERHQQISLRGKSTANQTMRLLGSLLNYAAVAYEVDDIPLISINPVKRLSDARLWHRERPRFGRITTGQMKEWYEAVTWLRTTGDINQACHADYFVFLVLTGMRRNEAAKLVWDDVNWKTNVITIQSTKNGDPLLMPMSDFVTDLLYKRLQDSKSGWVFPARGAGGPLTDPGDSQKKITDRTGIKFILHDLRRTFTDLCSDVRVPESMQDVLLNHRPKDVTAEYYRNKVEPEKLRPEIQKVTDRFMLLVNQPTPTSRKPRIKLSLHVAQAATS